MDRERDHWVPALQMTYDFYEETGTLIFSDGVKYTVAEAILIAKGRPTDETLRIIHAVKKEFDGVVEPFRFEAVVPFDDGEVPAAVPVPSV